MNRMLGGGLAACAGFDAASSAKGVATAVASAWRRVVLDEVLNSVFPSTAY